MMFSRAPWLLAKARRSRLERRGTIAEHFRGKFSKVSAVWRLAERLSSRSASRHAWQPGSPGSHKGVNPCAALFHPKKNRGHEPYPYGRFSNPGSPH
eukprot:scaffold40391_cov65-Phaeocystis_antarctica.AAC.5